LIQQNPESENANPPNPERENVETENPERKNMETQNLDLENQELENPDSENLKPENVETANSENTKSSFPVLMLAITGSAILVSGIAAIVVFALFAKRRKGK